MFAKEVDGGVEKIEVGKDPVIAKTRRNVVLVVGGDDPEHAPRVPEPLEAGLNAGNDLDFWDFRFDVLAHALDYQRQFVQGYADKF